MSTTTIGDKRHVTKIHFNWFYISCPEHGGTGYMIAEVGKLIDDGSGCKALIKSIHISHIQTSRFATIYFEDGSYQQVHNLNRVFYSAPEEVPQ